MTAPGQVTSATQDEATAVVGTAKDEAGHVASTAKGAAGDVAGTAKEQAGNVVGETVDQVKDLTAQVRESAAEQVGAQSERLAGSLRGMSRQLRDGDTSGVVGQVMGEVGQRAQGLADHLERVGPEGVLEDVRRYARRNPGTFLLGMAFAGFAAGRLTKGLAASKEQDDTTRRYGAVVGYPVPAVGDVAPYPEPAYEPGAVYERGPAYETGGAYEAAVPYESGTGTGWTEPAGSPRPPETRGTL